MDTAALTETVTTTSHPEDNCPTTALKGTELGQEMVQRTVGSHRKLKDRRRTWTHLYWGKQVLAAL